MVKVNVHKTKCTYFPPEVYAFITSCEHCTDIINSRNIHVCALPVQIILKSTSCTPDFLGWGMSQNHESPCTASRQLGPLFELAQNRNRCFFLCSGEHCSSTLFWVVYKAFSHSFRTSILLGESVFLKHCNFMSISNNCIYLLQMS